MLNIWGRESGRCAEGRSVRGGGEAAEDVPEGRSVRGRGEAAEEVPEGRSTEGRTAEEPPEGRSVRGGGGRAEIWENGFPLSVFLPPSCPRYVPGHGCRWIGGWGRRKPRRPAEGGWRSSGN